MSIKVMTLVWDKFPASGSELVTMLALADWCDDNGSSLYPSIKAIAEKIRASESQARRIVRGFEKSGFLDVVGNQSGGAPGTTRQYRVNVNYLRSLPDIFRQQTACTDATPSASATPSTHARDGLHGCARRVAPMRETGGTHASQTVNEPSKNHQGTINTQHSADADVAGAPVSVSKRAKRGGAKFDAIGFLVARQVPQQVADDWLAVRKAKSLANTMTAFEDIAAEAEAAGLPLGDVLRKCCIKGWGGFKASWLDKGRAVASIRPPQDQSGVDAANAASTEAARQMLFGKTALLEVPDHA